MVDSERLRKLRALSDSLDGHAARAVSEPVIERALVRKSSSSRPGSLRAEASSARNLAHCLQRAVEVLSRQATPPVPKPTVSVMPGNQALIAMGLTRCASGSWRHERGFSIDRHDDGMWQVSEAGALLALGQFRTARAAAMALVQHMEATDGSLGTRA
ncbi:hypothetical protein [Burkholderia sp. COPS]|uniref:hypothetical protein n=1 Tax=Burkholderia sp. COPS TaxID=2597663 RepID=UPI001CA50A35|nr:hypothetical protein [Burkholderia sp. COPS]